MKNPDNWPVDTSIIKSVEIEEDGHISITREDGWTFGITADEANVIDYTPKVGDDVVVLGGLGRPITGIFINDIQFRYITKAAAEAERQEWLNNYAREKEERFYANIADWVKRKNTLPDPLKARLDRFANKSGFKEFWLEDGGYELFVVEEAAVLIDVASNQEDPVAWIDEFKDMPQEDQGNYYVDTQHSGNTWHGMIRLARAVLNGDKV